MRLRGSALRTVLVGIVGAVVMVGAAIGLPSCSKFEGEPESDAGTADTSTASIAGCEKGKCRLVFVTSQAVGAKLGGVQGGDQKCNEAAGASGRTPLAERKFKAWLSAPTADATSRHVKSGVPYKRLDGTTVAKDWKELTSSSLAAPINVDELGATHPADLVWTGTMVSGEASTNTCAGWTADTAPLAGQIGRTDFTDEGWTDGDVPLKTTLSCTSVARLYCIEE